MMSAGQRTLGVTLGQLLDDCPPALAGREVGDLTLRSDEVGPGSVFVALAGGQRHGLEFLDRVLARGPAGVLWEPAEGVEAPVVPQGILALRVPLLRARLGGIADRFFGQPSAALRLAAVTGTNGKTTVAWLVAAALEDAGAPCAYIGTLGHGRPGELASSKLTTPDAVTLHRWLAQARDAGCRHGALEASSHALDQARLDGVRLDVAGFTNLSHDHLDYHGSMEAYAAAKARLFAWPGLGTAVINADDAAGAALLARLPAGVRAIAVSLNGRATGSDSLVGRVVPGQAVGLSLAWCLGESDGVIDSRLVGRFNAANLLVALGMLVGLGLSAEAAAARLARVQPPPGRMQLFGGAGRQPLVVVDFAHSPDALERVLEALREHRPGSRLVCVFGCGGDRDRAKRPLMGEVAARLADAVVLTDDNPRGEDGAAIIADIRAGLGQRPVTVIRDRGEAIAHAVREAGAGDVVLVAGKGHEREQWVGGQALPFSDEATVRAALEGGR